ncbi:hypothetical protein KI387_013633, partial [Taxus chinensis]
MECNKDKVKKAMEIAQRNLGLKDLEGARKVAVTVQQLYPPLLASPSSFPSPTFSSQLTTILMARWTVTLFSEFIILTKLALLPYPNKKKLFGFESAFKLVVEVWAVLSDKIRRAVYDQKKKANPRFKTCPQHRENLLRSRLHLQENHLQLDLLLPFPIPPLPLLLLISHNRASPQNSGQWIIILVCSVDTFL